MVEAVSRSGLRATKKQLFSLLESLNEHLRYLAHLLHLHPPYLGRRVVLQAAA